MILYGQNVLEKVFIIAELGINHNGDIEIAKELADIAYDCGADAVKIQFRNPKHSVPLEQWDKMRSTPWGEMRYIDYKKRIELDLHEVQELYAYSRLPVFPSVWDVGSLALWLNIFGDDELVKIPSAKNENKTLINMTGSLFKNVIVSLGMLDSPFPKPPTNNYAYMHCVSKYPCPNNKLNLKAIETLIYCLHGMVIGYSGHEVGIATTVAAVALGARIVERHITLNRTLWGTDQAASLEPEGLRKLCKYIRTVEEAMGDGTLRMDEIEKEDRLKMKGY